MFGGNGPERARLDGGKAQLCLSTVRDKAVKGQRHGNVKTGSSGAVPNRSNSRSAAIHPPLTLQLTRPQGDMAVAAHPSVMSCALILAHPVPVAGRQFAGSKS